MSFDGGVTWHARRRGIAFVDVAVDPDDPGHLLATAEPRQGALYESRDSGASWRLVSRESGLLAWPASSRLYLARRDGRVLVSIDDGRSFTPRGALARAPTALLARTERELYAALRDRTVHRSLDGGRSWSLYTTP